MKQLILALAFIISTYANQVQAAVPAVYVACYGNEEAFTMGFHAQDQWVTYIYSHWNLQDTFESEVSSPWSAAHSDVKVSVGADSVYLKAQIIGGDPITPLIETSAVLELNKDANGSWILTKADVYHNDIHYPLTQFVGHSCYVQ